MAESWPIDTREVGLAVLASWMFLSKFLKLLGHYIRYPVDFFLLPVSILFGYFHGLIKGYAMLSLNVVSFGFPISARVPCSQKQIWQARKDGLGMESNGDYRQPGAAERVPTTMTHTA